MVGSKRWEIVLARRVVGEIVGLEVLVCKDSEERGIRCCHKIVLANSSVECCCCVRGNSHCCIL